MLTRKSPILSWLSFIIKNILIIVICEVLFNCTYF